MLLTTESCGMSKVSLSLETTLPHHLQWIFKHIKCILFLIPLPLINKTSVCYTTNNIHKKFMQFWLAEKKCIFHVTWLQSYYTCAKLQPMDFFSYVITWFEMGKQKSKWLLKYIACLTNDILWMRCVLFFTEFSHSQINQDS